MLPKVSVGHYNSAISTNVDNYRILLGDELVDELRTLALDLKGFTCPRKSRPGSIKY
jgi:hypothetical protein